MINEDLNTMKTNATLAFDSIIQQSEAQNGIKLPLVCPAPGGKYEKLLLQGVGLKAVEAQIEELKIDFPRYDIIISDAEPAFTTNEGLPVYTIPFCGGTPFYLSFNKPSPFGLKRGLGYVATIGGFLSDEDEQRCFAFTAAHALVSEEHQLELSKLFGQHDQIQTYTREICLQLHADVVFNGKLKIQSHNSGSPMDVSNTPLFAAQIYIKMSDTLTNYQKFTHDFLLLPVSPQRVYCDPNQKIPYSYINKFKGRKSLGALLYEDPNEYEITHYLNITSEQDIADLRSRGVVVFVAGQTGTLEVAPSIVPGTSEYIHGWHIAFKTDNA